MDNETEDINTDVKREAAVEDTAITIKVREEGRTDIMTELMIASNKTIKDLKTEICRQLYSSLKLDPDDFSKTFRLILGSGFVLDNDAKIISDVHNIVDSCVITIARKILQGPGREASVLNGRQETSDHVRARLNNCRILQRNFEACVDAAQTSKDPAQRERYNESATPTPANPTARDFGYLVKDMANSLRTWSFQLHRLSDQLIRDEALPDKSSKEYELSRRLIQNNMDASRYMSPELQNFCQFVIPLGDVPPRGLAVMQKPQTKNDMISKNEKK